MNLLQRLAGFLTVVLGVFVATAVSRGSDGPEEDFAEEEKLLKDDKIATDGPGLLEFIRKRILTTAQIERIDILIKHLGDREFRNRLQATADLKDIGTAALPKLRLALKDKDAEVRRRAREIIDFIQSDTMSARLAAAARLLQDRRPDGAVRVLIDYLPFIEDSGIEEEVLVTLTRLGVEAGQVDPALLAALHSQAPAQRAAAAMVVGWAGTPEQRLIVKQLLHDARAMVRFRAAQGILAGRDKTAVPTLISLLQGVPLELSHHAEDLLQRAAGNSAPAVTLGDPAMTLWDSESDRNRCSAAWSDWSMLNLEKLDLTQRDVLLPPFDVNKRAKAVALRWIYGLAKRDRSKCRKISDVPFTHTMNHAILLINQREQLDQWLLRLDQWLLHKRGANAAKTARMTFVVKDVVSIDQYLKSAVTIFKDTDEAQLSAVLFPPSYLLGSAPEWVVTQLSAFFLKSGGNFRVVYIQGSMGRPDPEAMGAVFVRVRPGQLRVIGLGPGRHSGSSKE